MVSFYIGSCSSGGGDASSTPSVAEAHVAAEDAGAALSIPTNSQAKTGTHSDTPITDGGSSITNSNTDTQPPPPAVVVPSVTVSAPALTYTHDIVPIINANCKACHNTGSRDLSSYSAIMKFVSANNSAASLLYQRVKQPGGGNLPQGSHPLSSINQTTIKKWIDTGARQ